MLDNKPEFIIRKESVPRKWAELDAAQKNALYRILGMMEKYLDNENRTFKQTDAYPALRLNDDSNILFLDGDRGTGKSTVLYSLLNATLIGADKFFEGWIAQNKEDKDLADEVTPLISKMSCKSVIWLESLDLELLPEPANLYAALMVRIEDVFKREGINKEDSCFPYESTLFPTQPDHPWTRFSQLMRSVSIGWSTNLDGRKNSDPDTYSEEVIKTERSRLKLKEFNKIVSDLAEYVAQKKCGKKPLFVLPVDDADLNPSRVMDLFQLIRMISSPDILFLVAGRYENLQKLFELKYASDLCKRYPCSPHSDEHRDFIRELSSSTGYAAIKKLVPKGDQFVKLNGLSASEAFDFPYLGTEPNKNDFDSVRQVLDSISLHSDYLNPSETLGDLFFLTKALDKEALPVEESQISEIFQGPIRAIYELWRELLSLRNAMKKQYKAEKKLDLLIDFVGDGFLGVLDSEPALPAWTIQFLKSIFQNQAVLPRLEVKSKLIQVFPVLSPNPLENTSRDDGPAFVFHEAQYFNVRLQSSESEQIAYILDKFRTAWLLLHHDLTLLKPKNSIQRLDLKQGTQDWARSTIMETQSLLLPWPALDWFEFHHLSIFQSYWRIFLDKKIKSANNGLEQDDLDFAAYIWIRGLTYIVAGKKIPVSMLDKPKDRIARWNTHVTKFLSEINLDQASGFRVQYFVDLVKTIAIIISPERGVSQNVADVMYECMLMMLKKIQKIKNNFSRPSTKIILNEIAQVRAENILSIHNGKMQISFEEAYENIEFVVSSYFDQTLADKYIKGPGEKISSALKEFQDGVQNLKDVFNTQSLINVFNAMQSEQRPPLRSFSKNLIDDLEYFNQGFSHIFDEFKFEGPNIDSKKNFILRLLGFIFKIKKITREIDAILSEIGDIPTFIADHPQSQWSKFVESRFLQTISIALSKIDDEMDLREFSKFKEHPFEKYRGPELYIFTDYPLSIRTVLGKALALLQPISPENKSAYDSLTDLVQFLPESGERYQSKHA